jgi:hypothetical protein
MRTYRQMAASMMVPMCAGSCGITTRSHEQGFVFLDILHWRERKFTRRGGKNFLMLIAKWQRLLNPEYLNDPEHDWYYEWSDSVAAQSMAGDLGFRIPAHLFDHERARCLLLARKRGVKLPPTIRAWAMR